MSLRSGSHRTLTHHFSPLRREGPGQSRLLPSWLQLSPSGLRAPTLRPAQLPEGACPVPAWSHHSCGRIPPQRPPGSEQRGKPHSGLRGPTGCTPSPSHTHSSHTRRAPCRISEGASPRPELSPSLNSLQPLLSRRPVPRPSSPTSHCPPGHSLFPCSAFSP